MLDDLQPRPALAQRGEGNKMGVMKIGFLVACHHSCAQHVKYLLPFFSRLTMVMQRDPGHWLIYYIAMKCMTSL